MGIYNARYLRGLEVHCLVLPVNKFSPTLFIIITWSGQTVHVVDINAERNYTYLKVLAMYIIIQENLLVWRKKFSYRSVQ